MIREFFSRRAIPTWIALAALFVALGGPAAAVDLVSGKKISGNKIKRGTITAKQVKDGSLTEVELSPAAAAALRAVGPDAVTGASVVDGSLGGAELADGAVANADVGADAIETTKVQDGNMRGADVGRFAGSFTLTFPSIATGACATQTTTSLTPVASGQDLRDDAIVVTPSVSFPTSAVSVDAQPGGSDTISVTACNQTGAPVNLGQRNFQYLTVDVVGD